MLDLAPVVPQFQIGPACLQFGSRICSWMVCEQLIHVNPCYESCWPLLLKIIHMLNGSTVKYETYLHFKMSGNSTYSMIPEPTGHDWIHKSKPQAIINL